MDLGGPVARSSEPLNGAIDLPAEDYNTLPGLNPEDTAATKAELLQRNLVDEDGPPAKRLKRKADEVPSNGERVKGVAPIKAEFLVHAPGSRPDRGAAVVVDDDDAAEAVDHRHQGPKREKKRGQNKAREYGSSRDERGLCQSRATYPEFSPAPCRFGNSCKFEHDLRRYLKDWKREDLDTFGGRCPIWEIKGKCSSGWKCRFVGSHMMERDTADGRRELILVEDAPRVPGLPEEEDCEFGVVNVVSTQAKMDLTKKKTKTPKADAYINWLERTKERDRDDDPAADSVHVEEYRARYEEPPLLPSEKRRIYFGPETPVLAPLTTQGNLPFRRLCVDLGAQITYSEMAMSLPLLQGQKSEWALMKAHKSELTPPRYNRTGDRERSGSPVPPAVVQGYEHLTDLKFGAQIAANKPWVAVKATEVVTQLCPHLRVVDLNCGCPIDLVYRQGAGSALLDSQTKLDRILRGMNAVSGNVPITVKIRMGTKDGRPTAAKLVNRLVYGGYDEVGADPGETDRHASGVAAITLHGRSRQQRYTRSADWSYISTCAALINHHRRKGDDIADTIREAEAREQAASGRVYFIGNGDCYSHIDYYDHVQNANVDSVMVARGALIKPWIFEEIEKGQYLDKSATERLAYVEKFARYGLETWGSDEMGIGYTRRFLLEWLSFAYRYVPIGILDHLPPNLQDRPPAWRGRNDLESLLGSDNYRDWIKISEMFLGPANKDFKFQPKHKSNSYEIEAEG